MDYDKRVELWTQYFDAFHSRRILNLKEFYDPGCKIIVEGEVIANDRDHMLVNYADTWAKMKRRN